MTNGSSNFRLAVALGDQKRTGTSDLSETSQLRAGIEKLTGTPERLREALKPSARAAANRGADERYELGQAVQAFEQERP